MKETLSLTESMTVINSALHKGQSFIEIIRVQTGLTMQHIALIADEILKGLRSTTYELLKVKSLTGSTKPAIERSLSKSLVIFLNELNNQGGDCHYGTIRDTVQSKYELTVNDYSSLTYWRLIKKSKGLGMWMITERGIQFLKGQLKLSEKVTVKDNKVITATKNLVTIKDFIVFDDVSVVQELIEKRKDGLSSSH